MNVDIKENGGSVLATLNGRLDTAAAADVAGNFEELQTMADKEIKLDCTGLEYISSSGLRLFISLRKASAAKGGTVIIHLLYLHNSPHPYCLFHPLCWL